MGRLEQKVALVTGAGSGLGRAIALALAEEGATVVLTGRRAEKLHAVEKEIANGKAHVLAADVTDDAAVESLRDQLLSLTDGNLDILVDNVGGVPATGMDPIGLMPTNDWVEMIEKNLTSQFLVTKAFLPALRKSDNAKIISVTSAMSKFYVNGFGAYSASKAAVEALMKTVAAEEKPNGIEVHFFDPGNVVSEANPHGTQEPQEVVAPLIDMAA